MTQTSVAGAAGRKRGRRVLIGAVLSTVLALSACGEQASSGDKEASGEAVSLDAKEWDAIVDAATKEGEVVVYSSLSGVEKSFKKFEAKYPGIKVTIERAATSDIVTRLDQEIAVNAKGADVTLHSQYAWFDAVSKDKKLAAVKVSPEQADAGWSKLLDGKDYAYVMSNANLLAYNTKNAKPLKNAGELLDLTEKKKVGFIDVNISPVASFLYNLMNKTYGDDAIEKLGKLDHTIYGSNIPMSQSLAAGEIDYALNVTPSTLLELKAQGAPVDYVIPDEAGSGTPYNAAVLATSAHPNAAQLFLDWLMSKEGAEMFVESHGPASTPLQVEGSIPWGDLAVPEGWTQADHDEFIKTVWTPTFG